MTIDLPKEHKDAVGLAFYEALAATGPWERVNGTGTVISLLMTSTEASGVKEEQRLMEQQFMEWGLAMREYSTPNDDSQKYHAAWRCQKVLGKLGVLAYKYGKIPAGGFKVIPSGGSQ